MANVFDMKQAQTAALAKAEAQVKAAETGSRGMSEAETENYKTAMSEYRSLGETIKAREEQNTLGVAFQNGQHIAEPGRSRRAFNRPNSWCTPEHLDAFADFIKSNGAKIPGAGVDEFGGIRAANYEGGSTSGVSIVPVTIEQTIVPLAPPVIGIESIASVIPTSMDMKFPRKLAHGTAALKAEGDGTGSNLFTGSSPTTEQYTLSAFMVGHPEDISWELSQDVAAFLQFLQDDILLSIATKKEAYYATGTGSSQPQGIKGHVATGLTGVVADASSNLLPLSAVLQIQGKLNPVYKTNARYLMTVATGINLRMQQLASNLFSNVFTTDASGDRLFGTPITYSGSVDEIAAAATPLFYGDFKAGYQIGVRGGAGVNIKFLDQPKALEGLLTVLGYQRVDGRVRRSEAIQPVVLHA